jgi:hypothetical protein
VEVLRLLVCCDEFFKVRPCKGKAKHKIMSCFFARSATVQEGLDVMNITLNGPSDVPAMYESLFALYRRHPFFSPRMPPGQKF